MDAIKVEDSRMQQAVAEAQKRLNSIIAGTPLAPYAGSSQSGRIVVNVESTPASASSPTVRIAPERSQ